MSPVHNLSSLSPLTVFHSLPQLMETTNATSVESVFNDVLKAVSNFNRACMTISFIGLVAYGGQRSLRNKEECNAGLIHAERLIIFMLIAFSSSFLSTVLVIIVKLAIAFLGQESTGLYFQKMFNLKRIKKLMMFSLLAEVFGSMGMILSASELMQIRIGFFCCGVSSAINAFIFFALAMSISVIFHVCMVGYGVYTLPILRR